MFSRPAFLPPPPSALSLPRKRDSWRCQTRDKRFNFLLVATLSLTFLGCGTAPVRTLPEQYETVFIRMAKNSTFEYGAEERLTESMVREFERDGRLRQTANWETADLVLELDITQYDLDPVTLDDDNRAAGRNLRVTVKAGARSPQTGEWVMPEQSFSDQGTFFLSNVPGGRREDDVYRRVAESIVSRLIEGWG